MKIIVYLQENKFKIFFAASCLSFIALYLMFTYKKELYIFFNDVLYGSELSSIIESRRDELSSFYTNKGYFDKNVYIAHGGGLGEFKYTNSLEALEDSINKNFNFIELDLQETKDGCIVGVHDWSRLKKSIQWIDDRDKPLLKNDILDKRINNKYTPLFGSDIKRVMENTSFVLVTDKIRNYKLLLDTVPFPDRLIVEVFTPKDYLNALKTGVKFPAYTISNRVRYEIAKKFNFPIVTLDANIFFKDPESIQLVQKMHDDGITILLYHSYDPDNFETIEFAKEHLGKTVSKIYTDRFSPEGLGIK